MLLCAFVCFGEASAQDVKVEQKGNGTATQAGAVQQGGVQQVLTPPGGTVDVNTDRTNRRRRTRVGSDPQTSGSTQNAVVDMSGDTVHIADMDSIQRMAMEAEMLELRRQEQRDSAELADYGKQRVMKIDPNRALWLSMLCPGLGQVYNRRYWKLPIVVGGFVGMGYAISWNNKMLKDYTKAYSDIMDNDPNTKSYMDFYPPTVSESDIDPEYLKKTLKAKKDFFRRNRDLCIIGIAGVYLICLVDAYVDAAMSKFDISDDLSMKVKPTLIEPSSTGKLPSVGVACAFTF
ncbi:MAG: DUF5683 domain-containing protein [Muribaculaceae bacterium]